MIGMEVISLFVFVSDHTLHTSPRHLIQPQAASLVPFLFFILFCLTLDGDTLNKDASLY
jgi:hypothetical protein